MTKQKLTKTDYLQYLVCPEELWLQKNEATKLAPISADALFKMEQGNIIDKLAQQLFAQDGSVQGISIEHKTVQFQEKAETDSFLAKADITTTNPASGATDIFEVKAATGVKAEHIHDVAFQSMVFQNSGVTIGKCYLIHVNSNYVMNGKIDLPNYLQIEEITEEVQAIVTSTHTRAEEALAFIQGPTPPKRITIGCGNKLNCPFVLQHYTDLPDYSVYDISRINKDKLATLVAAGQLDIMDVPADFKLSDKQRAQVDMAQQQKITIKREAIKAILDQLEWPLYFLDYETFAYVMPPQAGHRPYQQMLFQYSLHVLDGPGEPIQHYEYLLRERTEPVENLVLSLRKNIKETGGTVIVWNESFEKKINNEVAGLLPQQADFLHSVNDRVYDLMQIFRQGLYLHPGFKGSNSIKDVLPVLCPELNYKDLEVVQSGTDAVVQWHHMTDGRVGAGARAATHEALLRYCELDTWAMVRIWEELVGI